MISTATVTDAIREENRNFAKSFASRDASGIAQLYRADAMLLPPDADLVQGQDNILSFWRRAMETAMSDIEEVVLDSVDLETSGDLAVEVGRYTLRTDGAERAGDGKYLVVWKQERGAWKILRDVWNAND